MKITLRLLLLVLFTVLTFSVFVPAEVFAAEDESISDLSLAYGADGVQTLEESGYTVMGRPLTGDVWLGYKKGGTPVTGLIVSSAESDTLTADGIIYQRAGSIGSVGSLYITRESGAGAPVLSLNLQSDEGLADQPLYALKNDGSSPLRRENGKPCDLGDGQTAYLFILRENVFRPYISGVTAVSGDDLRAAITAAATAGCNYYYDPGLETENGRPVVLGYTRTAYETDAITCIAAGTDTPVVEGVIFESAGEISIEAESPYRLYQTHDRSAGNPIVALTGSAVPVRSSDVMNKWAEKTFVKFNTSAASVNLVKSETMYKSFLKDESPLTHVGVHDVSAGGVITPLAYTCKAAGLPVISFDSNAVEEDLQADDEPENNTDDEIGTDSDIAPDAVSDDSFYQEGYLEDEAEKIADDDEPDYVTASVFGSGTAPGVIIVLVLAALGAAGGFAAAAVRNRKRISEDGQDNEN